MHIWSERPGSRAREIAADVITLLWLTIWITLGIRLYGFLANLAGAGRFVREGGAGITSAGESIGSALEGIPLIGEGVATGVRGALAGAGAPFIAFGTDLERLLLVISALLGLLLIAAALVPWLNRYLPWRIAKWRRLNAAVRAIRGSRRARREPIADSALEALLASRAIHRLEYDELLEFTPDPFGDWLAGRHELLAQAELDRVGLRAISAPR
ncbi:MAG: hypothetical protein H0W98_03220 [Chloroflexi bacterium]|nr:hypothetical protein [Chloroflexota bacterium]MBA3740143.1 hypothetical protein [Chloroflexota bacterium]